MASNSKTKINRKHLPASVDPATKLERAVARWINAQSMEYEEGWRGVMRDLMRGGCSTGYVGHLIYLKDCTAFFDRHAEEIGAMLYAVLDEHRTTCADLFNRSGWDSADPLARGDVNKGILAWVAWEHTASELACRAGWEGD